MYRKPEQQKVTKSGPKPTQSKLAPIPVASSREDSLSMNEDEKWEEADDVMLRSILEHDIPESVTTTSPQTSPTDGTEPHSKMYEKPPPQKHAAGNSESYDLHSYSGDEMYGKGMGGNDGVTAGNVESEDVEPRHEVQQSESYEPHSYSDGGLYGKGAKKMGAHLEDAVMGAVHAMNNSESYEPRSYSGFDLYGPGDREPRSPESYKE